MTLEEIRTCCEGILEPYQVPDSIDVVGTLPETPYGKINKRLLREPYW
jgi:fatty-acyl-CoA synthase/long-chain acyl-CoA synthetase